MKARILTLNAFLIAIILVMSLVPFIGFIQIGPIAITLTHIPVLIGAIYLGPASGVLLGLTFGIGSWLAALFRAATPLDLLFVNPLVAILPRVLFGLLTAYLWKALNRGMTEKSAIKIGFTAFTGTLIHTIAVFAAIYIAIAFGNQADLLVYVETGLWPFLLSAFSVNALAEALLALYFTLAILKALHFVSEPKKPAFIPRPLVSANQSVIILAVITTWITSIPYFLLIPLLFGSMGVLFNENPVMVIGRKFLRKPLAEYHKEDPDAQRFSQIIALVLLLISFIAYLLGQEVIGTIASAFVVLAATIALLGFCVGCFIFYQLSSSRQRRKKIS